VARYTHAKLDKITPLTILFTAAAAVRSHRGQPLPPRDDDDKSAHCAGPSAIHTSAISDSSMVAS
jgi:hypothetical protein